MLISTDSNGTGTGTSHEAFLRALDHSASRAIAQSCWQGTGPIAILAVTLIFLVAIAAAREWLVQHQSVRRLPRLPRET